VVTDHLQTKHGRLPLPAFLPDATKGVVRTLDSVDLEAVGVSGIVVNTFHLGVHPGATLVKRVGGVHRFVGWRGPIVSDSGGFQVYSLAKENSDWVSVSKKGLQYRRHRGDKRHILSPEKCVQQQLALGSDIIYCLDHCTHSDAAERDQRTSVEHTLDWARRCRAEFDQRTADLPVAERPLLFGVVQGGASRALRSTCAEQLLELEFDGYGYGGWPISDEGELVEMVHFVAELLPADAPKHALGIGKPENVVRALQAGYQMFDCVLPTRDARHGRLYVFRPDWESRAAADNDFYEFVYIRDEQNCADDAPLDASCDCLTCSRYSRAYLNHLFTIGDATAHRLATIHNLRFYVRLFDLLRTTASSRVAS